MILITKDPASVEPYGWDWTTWLAGLGGSPLPTIDQSFYTVSGKDAALTLQDASIVTGQQKTQTRLVGGTLGGIYYVTNRIIATSGDQGEKTWKVLIQQE